MITLNGNELTRTTCTACGAELLAETNVLYWYCGRCGEKLDMTKKPKNEHRRVAVKLRKRSDNAVKSEPEAVAEAVGEKTEEVAVTVAETVEEKAEEVAEAVAETVEEKTEEVAEAAAETVEEKAEEAAEAAAETVGEKTEEIAEAVAETVEKKTEEVAEAAAETAGEKTEEAAEAAAETAGEKAEEVAEAAAETVEEKAEEVAETAAEKAPEPEKKPERQLTGLEKMEREFARRTAEKNAAKQEPAKAEEKPAQPENTAKKPAETPAGNLPEFQMEFVTLVKYNGNSETVMLPKSIVKIGPNAFKGNTTLKYINIPDTVTAIGANAFEDCTALETVNIPESVSKINYKTFNNCSSLKKITIPKNVKEIAFNAMCCGLQEIVFESNATKWDTSNADTDPSFKVDRKGDGDGVSKLTYKGVSYEAAEVFRHRSIGAYLRAQGLCPHCGGQYNLMKKCKNCGYKKDY
ncbi:MAG: leucine-rich repeat domain-containing protein [Ruminococcus sp.]|nr:leucine-rich repeat domain-containing protein [Ruminococcus sp.]